MELETLEVLLDINTERVMQSLEKVLPQIENAMSRIERMSGNSMDKTEKNMDIDKGASNFTKQLEKMNQTLEKSMANFEKIAKQTSESVGTNLSTGVRKARPKVTKEIDAMVNEINAKMGQAKTAQEKVAYLKSQRQTASSQGDTGQVVKYDEQIARAQAQMTKFQDQAKGIGNAMKRELDSVPASLDNITKGMSQNEAQIEAMRKRIRTLKAEYNDQRVPAGSFSSGLKNYEDTPQSLKTSNEIQKQSIKMNKLISDNDRLQKEYAQTEDRADALRRALQRVNSALGQSSIQTGNASSGASMTGTGLKQSERAVSRYGGVFNRMSNAVSHGFGSVGNGLKNSLGFIGKFGSLFSSNSNKVTAGTNRMTGSTNAFGQSMKYLLPSLVVYQLLGGAITKMASGMMSALKTNAQFASSLNQIKVNLLTAFYPIYTAILPAINTMMSALATLTGQLAAFIAMIFGTTYDAAKQGASGLYDNVQALNETGSSANKAHEKVKKLQKSLMGFDEINNLTVSADDKSLDADAGETPGVDFGLAMGTYGTPKWMTDIQKILKDFFKPFQDAWKNQGKKVIDAWKYALSEVIGLASSIGKSFMEVWTNGTGQLFIENILKLLATMLNIIGDIARAFKNAWNDNNRGTKLIQSIFDLWNRVLELLNAVGGAFREAWNDGTGERIAGHILEILTNIFNSLGNIANSWKKIFEDNTGKSIVDGLLGVIEVLLEKINNISAIFEKWTSSLDFKPLAKSFDRLVASIKPLVGNIGDALAWFLENVLLPIGSYVIEDALPFFFDTLSGVLEALSYVIKRLKPFISWFFDKLIKPVVNFTLSAVSQWLEFLGRFRDALVGLINLDTSGFKSIVDDFKQFGIDIWNGLKEGISEALSNIWSWMQENVFNPIVNTFKSLFGIHSPSTVFAEFGGFLMDGLYNGIKELMSKPIELVGGIFNDMKTAVSEKTTEIFDKSKELWGKTKETVGTFAGKIKDGVADKFGGAWEATKGAWNKVTDWTGTTWKKTKGAVGDAITGAKKSVVENTKNILDNMKSRWSDTGKETDKTFNNVDKKVTDSTKNANKNATSRMTELRNNLRNRFNDTWTSARSNFDNIFNKVDRQSNNANSRGSSAFRNMKSSMVGSLNGLKSTTKSVFDNIGKWAVDLPNRISKGLTSGVSAIKKAAGKIGDGMTGVIGGAVNGVVNGIKWILNQVGASNAAKKLGRFATPKYPKYAQGTGYHPGGMAIVNDGSGPNYQEAYRTPDGTTGLFPAQRNLMVNLPAGTSVLSGPRTAKMMQGLPAYKNGVGDWFKETWSKTKKIASDVWSYAKDPSKLLNAAVSKYVNLKGIGQPNLTIAQGAVGKMIDGAKGWITDKFNKGYEKHQSELALSSASFGSGAFAPHFRRPPFTQTSDFGNRAALFGRSFHNGMDFAAPLGTPLPAQHPGRVSWASRVPSYGNLVAVEVANGVRTLYGHMNSIGVKVGQNVKRNQILGTVGSTGDSTGPHVHYELKTGGVPPWGGTTRDPKTYGQQASGALAGATGVYKGGWAGQIKKAADMMKQSITQSQINGILAQIKRESGGNERIIQSSAVWDINMANGNPARGLLQYIPETFNAYRVRGYGNIMNGFHQLMAFFNNSNWRSDLPYGRSGWGPTGRRLTGYENGGLVTQDGIYRMGEGNKKEMVIPLERPQRAAELIQQAVEYLGLDMFNSGVTLPEMFQKPSFTPTNSTFSNNDQMRYQGGGMQQSFEAMINGIMMAITSMGGQPQQASNGDIIINIGGKEFGRIAVKEINKYHQQLGYTELNI